MKVHGAGGVGSCCLTEASGGVSIQFGFSIVSIEIRVALVNLNYLHSISLQKKTPMLCAGNLFTTLPPPVKGTQQSTSTIGPAVQ